MSAISPSVKLLFVFFKYPSGRVKIKLRLTTLPPPAKKCIPGIWRTSYQVVSGRYESEPNFESVIVVLVLTII